MENEKNTEAIYDARVLGKGRMFVLGLQHMFAMFGATVLVPAITGLNVSTTLLFAGLGTLLFHLITGRKVPAFLGSSFAFLGAYGLVTASGADIPIEERGGGEVRSVGGVEVVPEEIKVWNPAFDVTPNELITGIITERGIIRAPFAENIKKFFPGRKG